GNARADIAHRGQHLKHIDVVATRRTREVGEMCASIIAFLSPSFPDCYAFSMAGQPAVARPVATLSHVKWTSTTNARRWSVRPCSLLHLFLRELVGRNGPPSRRLRTVPHVCSS